MGDCSSPSPIWRGSSASNLNRAAESEREIRARFDTLERVRGARQSITTRRRGNGIRVEGLKQGGTAAPKPHGPTATRRAQRTRRTRRESFTIARREPVGRRPEAGDRGNVRSTNTNRSVLSCLYSCCARYLSRASRGPTGDTLKDDAPHAFFQEDSIEFSSNPMRSPVVRRYEIT